MKTVVVQWDADAHKEFVRLQRAVLEGKKATGRPSYGQLLLSINNAIQRLKADAFCGDLIPRRYLSKKVIARYGTDKVFRIGLAGYWRMLYTVVGDEAQIIAFILEYMDHPSYDRLFGYRKR
jgi:hypothetical protein